MRPTHAWTGAIAVRAVAGILLVATAGCGLLLPPRPDPSRFYTLSAVGDGVAVPRDGGPSVVVGPVTMPSYLDRIEVAVRVSPTELKYAVAERWAEPLVQNVTRVLVEDVGTALGSDRVVSLTANPGFPTDFAIEVIVLRFEATADGTAELTARWALRDRHRKIVRIRQSQHERRSTAATTEGGVKALSAALGDLADEMASTIREVIAESPAPSGSAS
jgi:uncharacterized lipoprotein YmbA